jgi:AcrR family transcriptional regulator
MRTEEPCDHGGLPDPTALSGNELAKSRATRRRILDAATRLLAEQGYTRFSTGAVASRAGLTRPAMLYHFGSRRELVNAVINHVTRQRIEAFTAAMAKLSAVPGYDPGYRGQTFRAAAIDVSWELLDTPEFAAFTELVMAARTDRDLAEAVRPALAAFDRSRRETSERVFPPGSWDLDDFQLARDVARFLTEGVMQQNSIVEEREQRLAALRHFLRMLAATTAGSLFLEAVMTDWKQQHRAPPDGASVPPGSP